MDKVFESKTEPTQTGGIVGSFLLEKPDKKTYELIKAMEILHIGKQTSFGLGEVKVR